MYKAIAVILAAAALVPPARGGETSGSWKLLQGATYKIFSGSGVAYSDLPGSTDRKLSIHIEDQPAKEIFDSIGPDAREMCSAEKGDRERNKGGIQCSYSAKDAKDSGKGYRCWIGVNLRNGQSVPTVPC